MNRKNFQVTVEDGIVTLLVDRPEKKNALTAAMLEDLGTLCREIEERDDVRVVLLSGNGNAFCAGGDIDEWSGSSADHFARRWLRDGHEALDRLARLRQPVIAVLNGHTLGGGLELAACADYRIAEAHVRLGQPETGLGIIAGWSGTQRAVRRFGARQVRRMAIFGEVLTAEQGFAAGIVDQVCETGQGLQCGRDLAIRLLSRATVATELTKKLVNAAEGEEVGRVLETLAGQIAASGSELREGLKAFREKRKPNFRA